MNLFAKIKSKSKRINQISMLLILALVLGVCFYGISAWSMQGDDRTIVYRKNGFHPKNLTIRVGEKVQFRNAASKLFWPASSIHPSHEIYPEFDAKIPLEPGTIWEFTFDKPGKWRFHDHISPDFTGAITVLPVGSNVLEPVDCESLADGDQIGKQQCWNEALITAYEHDGLDGAFKKFTWLYNNDEAFVKSACHVHAHELGHIFFQDFLKKGSVESIRFPVESASCGYGFFHGLFEHFFRSRPDVKLVGAICDSLDIKYGGEMPLLRINCYHGAGHGFVTDPPEIKNWGRPDLIAPASLTACDKVSKNAGEVEQCIEGVFNVFVDWTWRGVYGMKINDSDPFWLCKIQNDRYKLPCFYEWVMRLQAQTGNKFIHTVQTIIMPLEDAEVQELTVRSLAASFIQYHILSLDFSILIKACRGIDRSLQSACVDGLTNGFRSHGEPGNEYVKMRSFCQHIDLTESERRVCFDGFTRNLWYMYSDDKVRTICSTLEKKYMDGCKNNPLN